MIVVLVPNTALTRVALRYIFTLMTSFNGHEKNVCGILSVFVFGVHNMEKLGWS